MQKGGEEDSGQSDQTRMRNGPGPNGCERERRRGQGQEEGQGRGTGQRDQGSGGCVGGQEPPGAWGQQFEQVTAQTQVDPGPNGKGRIQDEDPDLPDNFKIGQAIGGGDCFFDSVAQGLKRLKPDMDISVKSLREVCKDLAEDNQQVKRKILWDAMNWHDPTNIIPINSANDEELWKTYLSSIEYTSQDIKDIQMDNPPLHESLTGSQYGNTLRAPIWGRPDIEGQMICKKYNVKLHLIEKFPARWLHQVVDEECSKSVENADYNDDSTVHIINKGNSHFEPILGIQKIQHRQASVHRHTSLDYYSHPGSPCGDGSNPRRHSSASTQNQNRNQQLEYTIARVDRRPGMRELPPMKLAQPASYGEWGQPPQPALLRPIEASSTPDTSACDQQRGRAPEQPKQQQPCPQPPQHQPQQHPQKTVIQPILDTQEIPHQEQKSPDNDEGTTSLGQVFSDRVDQHQQLWYKRRVGTSGMGGQLYEIELLMLFLLGGVTQKGDKKIDKFYLATNMEDAGDFDDVVFKYECNENGIKKSSIVFLQAKHKETAREIRITIDTLLSQSEKGDFNLRKYFSSYRKIKQLRKKEENLLFKDGVERSSFVIYTNAVLNFDKSRDCVGKAYLESGDILNLKDHSQEYYYKLNANEEVMNALRHSLDFEILVKELAQSFSSGSIDVNKTIFKDYQVSLMERVFEKKTQREGKLREEFLNSKQESEFRNAYFQEIKKKEEFAKKSDEELKEELIKKNFQFKSNFGSANDNLRIPLPSKLYSDQDIKAFLCELKLFVSQPNEALLGGILKQKIQEIYKVEQNEIKAVFADVEYKVRKWWREGNGYITESNTFFQESARISIWFDVKSPVDSFTGRDKELDELHSKLQGGSETPTEISQMIAISGLGGIGKSELARMYVYKYANDYYDGNVIWINAESYRSLDESFRRLAQVKLKMDVKATDLKYIVENVYGFFSKFAKRKSLFIFDNAEKPKTGNEDLHSFLPSNTNKPYIIITSRDQVWGNIEVLPLGIFTENEVMLFIRTALNIKDDSQESEIRQLKEILQRFPLALQQAVAYINERDKALKNVGSRFEISAYLKRYAEETKQLLNFEFPDDSSRYLYTKTTFTTWKLTTNKIKENKEYGKQAGKILDTIAYFAPDNIPIEMFLADDDDNDDDKEKLGGAIQLLKKYSMINSGQEQNVLNVHRLVQQVTRIEIEGQGQHEEIVQDAFLLLRKYFPYGKDTSEDYSKKRELLPHFEVFLSHIDNWVAKEPVGVDKEKTKTEFRINALLILMSDGYSDLGHHRRKKELLERALAIQQTHYGLDHFIVAKTIDNLGTTYGTLGDHQKQKHLIQHALPIFEAHYGPDHFVVAVTLMNLGTAEGNLGNHSIKKNLLERSLTIQEKYYANKEDNQFEVAITLVNLANAYGALGDHQKRKDMLQRALEIQEKHYDHDNLEIVITLLNLVNAYWVLSDHRKTTDLLERVLTIQEKYYGREHFEVARTLVNLGSAHEVLGELQKKEAMLARALPILERNSLHFACSSGNLDMVKILLEEEANVLERNGHATVLHQAVCRDNEEIIRLILGKIKIITKDKQNFYVHINAIDTVGDTPLMWAAEGGKTCAAKILLENEASPNIQNDDRETALHWAAKGGYQEIVILLLNNQADPNIPDKNKKLPLHLAQEKLSQDPENDNLKTITALLLSLTGE